MDDDYKMIQTGSEYCPISSLLIFSLSLNTENSLFNLPTLGTLAQLKAFYNNSIFNNGKIKIVL